MNSQDSPLKCSRYWTLFANTVLYFYHLCYDLQSRYVHKILLNITSENCGFHWPLRKKWKSTAFEHITKWSFSLLRENNLLTSANFTNSITVIIWQQNPNLILHWRSRSSAGLGCWKHIFGTQWVGCRDEEACTILPALNPEAVPNRAGKLPLGNAKVVVVRGGGGEWSCVQPETQVSWKNVLHATISIR